MIALKRLAVVLSLACSFVAEGMPGRAETAIFVSDHPVYRPMASAYMNRGGVVDTLQWEGFREGVDDIRYASLLKLLARDAIASNDVRRAIEAKKALQYLALLKPGEMDLNVVRAEIVDRILKMLARAEARASR